MAPGQLCWPCGIEAQKKKSEYLILEKRKYRPIPIFSYRQSHHDFFFHLEEKLEMGDIPSMLFSNKPNRPEATEIPGRTCKHLRAIKISLYEDVLQLEKNADVLSSKHHKG